MTQSKKETARDHYPAWIMAKLRWLEYTQLPERSLAREVSKKFCFLGYELADVVMAKSAEADMADQYAIDQFLIALQRIIDAKDAAVRATLSIQVEE